MIDKISRPNPTPHTFVRVCLGACNFATPRDLRLRGAGRGASQRHVAPLPHLHIRAGGVVQDIRWYWNNDHIATTTTIARLPRVPRVQLARSSATPFAWIDGYLAEIGTDLPMSRCVYANISHHEGAIRANSIVKSGNRSDELYRIEFKCCALINRIFRTKIRLRIGLLLVEWLFWFFYCEMFRMSKFNYHSLGWILLWVRYDDGTMKFWKITRKCNIFDK